MASAGPPSSSVSAYRMEKKLVIIF